MFLAALTAALTTLKHCQFGHCCPVRVHDGGDEAGEPRDSGGASTEKVKDPKKVAAGRAGAAARKAKQEERLLEQLRAAKESFRPTPPSPIPHPLPAAPANIPPKGTKRFPSRNAVKDLLTGPHGSLGLVLQVGRLCFSNKQEVPLLWRQASLTPHPSSLWISPLGQIAN